MRKACKSTNMENDIAICRLADVYLMKAEALVRMGGYLGGSYSSGKRLSGKGLMVIPIIITRA